MEETKVILDIVEYERLKALDKDFKELLESKRKALKEEANKLATAKLLHEFLESNTVPIFSEYFFTYRIKPLNEVALKIISERINNMSVWDLLKMKFGKKG